MNRVLASVCFAGAMAAAGMAAAQEPPAQLSVDEVVESFADQPAQAAEPAGPQGECEKRGMYTGEDGLCEPAKGTRGFSLPGASTASRPRPAASAAVATAVPRTPSRRPAVAATAQARKDLLITFQTGSAELTEQGRANARVFAQAANTPQLRPVRFEIAGHTDAVGTRDKNLTLSQQRAESVKAYLVSLGVDPARLEAKGYGFDRPIVAANPRAAANRRVEAKRVN
jgi:OmpA-OmpF porin, OOP family